jgi:hypothetical protein
MSGTSRIQLIRIAVHFRAHWAAAVARGPPVCATLEGAGAHRDERSLLHRPIVGGASSETGHIVPLLAMSSGMIAACAGCASNSLLHGMALARVEPGTSSSQWRGKLRKFLAEASTVTGCALLLMSSTVARGNDGELDASGEYPAVGVMTAVVTLGEQLEWAGTFCSGTLIASDTYLTAGHCLFGDARDAMEAPDFVVEYWVSFDSVVEDDDFFCFLQTIGPYDVYCDPGRVKPVTFHHASVRIIHHEYARITQEGNGTLNIQELFTKDYIDLAVLLLDETPMGITPVPTAGLGTFDDKNEYKGIPLIDVGYGLDFHKFTPAEPMQPGGAGPTTFQGDSGVRRIADIGTIREITSQTIIPTQQSALGEDSVCYGDSGSPLFLRNADGTMAQMVSGVLTGWAQWCAGAYDPFWRVDTLEAVGFLACVEAATTTQEACECGIEDRLGLCGS